MKRDGDRCFGDGDPLYERYHDEEWGRPVVDERGLFERLCLEAFQSGLSWLIVLRKREAIRRAFGDFDVRAVARFSHADVARLLEDPSIIRNRGKISAVVASARATLALWEEGSSLRSLLWGAAPPPRPAPVSFDDVPASTDGSVALARDLRRRGFRFVGPTTVYATMQAVGVVNDHLVSCPVRDQVEADRASVGPAGRPPGPGR
ncbi:MAG: DNA-3-methyladenine glycosylase I [Actinomycetota bacterium]